MKNSLLLFDIFYLLAIVVFMVLLKKASADNLLLIQHAIPVRPDAVPDAPIKLHRRVAVVDSRIKNLGN
jgi:hypothetical protein